MDEAKIEFKMLEVKLIGSNTVNFRLEDGAHVRITVDIDRAGVALNYTNPDGTTHYNIGISSKVIVTPADKKFTVPKSQLPQPFPKKEDQPPIQYR
jgi:hypothetical protein